MKEQIPTPEGLPKGSFPCKEVRAWFQCSIKIFVDDTQDIFILIL